MNVHLFFRNLSGRYVKRKFLYTLQTNDICVHLQYPFYIEGIIVYLYCWYDIVYSSNINQYQREIERERETERERKRETERETERDGEREREREREEREKHRQTIILGYIEEKDRQRDGHTFSGWLGTLKFYLTYLRNVQITSLPRREKTQMRMAWS